MYINQLRSLFESEFQFFVSLLLLFVLKYNETFFFSIVLFSFHRRPIVCIDCVLEEEKKVCSLSSIISLLLLLTSNEKMRTERKETKMHSALILPACISSVRCMYFAKGINRQRQRREKKKETEKRIEKNLKNDPFFFRKS